MKTLHYILFVAVAAVLFSSCSSLSISRKRYSRGLNIDWTSAKEEKKKETVVRVNPRPKSVDVVKTEDEENSVETADKDDLAQSVEEEAINDDSDMELAPEAVSATETVLTSAEKKRSPVKEIRAIAKLKKQLRDARADVSMGMAGKTAGIDSTTNDSDVALIILIILALIPPLTLLAVYLYYGEINIHFWLNLLFLLLAGGVFLGGASVGLGLPIIHALLVVLGVFG